MISDATMAEAELPRALRDRLQLNGTRIPILLPGEKLSTVTARDTQPAPAGWDSLENVR